MCGYSLDPSHSPVKFPSTIVFWSTKYLLPSSPNIPASRRHCVRYRPADRPEREEPQTDDMKGGETLSSDLDVVGGRCLSAGGGRDRSPSMVTPHHLFDVVTMGDSGSVVGPLVKSTRPLDPYRLQPKGHLVKHFPTRPSLPLYLRIIPLGCFGVILRLLRGFSVSRRLGTVRRPGDTTLVLPGMEPHVLS